MDTQEIRALLGKSIFERAQKYRKRILQSSCTTNEDGVRHLTALVQGSGPDCYYTQVWLRENGSFVSASCSCPYNENGEGPCCKHIGALLMWDSESQGLSGRAPQKPSESPESIPGVVRGTANLQTPQPEESPRRDSYASSLEMLFGKKWRGEEPESDYEAQRLLRAYQEGALAEVDGVTELESSSCYTVDRVRVDGSKTLDQRWPFMCLSVIDGEGTVCGDPVHKGSHLLAPSAVSSIDLEGKMELIVSHL